MKRALVSLLKQLTKSGDLSDAKVSAEYKRAYESVLKFL